MNLISRKYFFMSNPSPNRETFYDRAPKLVQIETTSQMGIVKNLPFSFDKKSFIENGFYSCVSPTSFQARKIKISIDENFGSDLVTIGHIELK